MKTKAFQIFCLVLFFVFSIFVCNGVFAADKDPYGTDNQEETQESAFQNPTQAQRAINLAEAYAEKPDPELEAALNEVEKAEQALAKAKEDEDEDEIEKMEKALAEKQEAADSYMAENAGVTAEDIGDMREEGMGWGEIAHELGLHPSVLGMGHAKAYKEKEAHARGFGPGGEVSDKEIKDATARNFKSGFSKGHGAGADKGDKSNNGNGSGKDKDKSDPGQSGSNKSNSNKGGNGKGGGNGNGKK